MDEFSKKVPLCDYPQTPSCNIMPNSEHIYYIGKDGEINELFCIKSQWKYSCLTRVGSGPPADVKRSNIVSYNNGSVKQFLFYIGKEGHIHELYCNLGYGWKHFDHSATIPSTADALNLVALPASIFFMRSSDNQIHYMSFDFNRWKWIYSNASNSANAPPASHEKFMVYTTKAGTYHIIYKGVDENIYSLESMKGGWSFMNLTEKAKAPQVGEGGVAAHVIFHQHDISYFSQHIFFRAKGTGDVCQIQYPTKGNVWNFMNLTQITNAPPMKMEGGGLVTLDPNHHQVFNIHRVWCRNNGAIFEFSFEKNDWKFRKVTSFDIIPIEKDLEPILMTKTSTKENPTECVICMERKVEVVLLPCGHCVLCSQCGNNITGGKCPMCRASIQQIHRIFF